MLDPDHPTTIVPRVRQTLATAGIMTTSVVAAPHFDGPAMLTVRLQVLVGRVRDAMATGPELCHALARSGVRVYQDARGLLAIEVPKLRPARVPLARMAPWQIGLTALGKPVEVDLSRESNAVFCGSTRSGKTTAMQVAALHAARADARLVIADGKGRRWDAFAGSAARIVAAPGQPGPAAAGCGCQHDRPDEESPDEGRVATEAERRASPARPVAGGGGGLLEGWRALSKAPRYTLILYGVRTEHDDLMGRSIYIENEIEDDSDPIRHPHPKDPSIVTAWPTGRRRLIVDGRVVCDYGMEAYWSIERTGGDT